MLRNFAPDIWILDGSTVDVVGFHYPTRCAVVRLNGNDLLVWSPVAFTSKLQAQIDQLGTLTHLIAPNSFHHLFLADWQTAYPQARLFGTPALINKRGDLGFADALDDKPARAWAAALDQVVVDHKLSPEVVFFHKASRTAIFADLIQQFPPGWHKGWRGIVARLDLMVGNAPKVPRKFRLGFGNKVQARETIGRILDWPTERVILAHGAPVQQNGRAVLQDAFHWLMK